jgi:hypothetical protein
MKVDFNGVIASINDSCEEVGNLITELNLGHIEKHIPACVWRFFKFHARAMLRIVVA